MQSPTRRRLVMAAGAAILSSPARAAAPLVATPEMTEGPFYPDHLPSDLDSDLVKVAGRNGQASGEILALSGRVLGLDGNPIRGAVVEIWQVDAHGHYLHSGDYAEGERDANFQGYGRAQVDAQGLYRFRTLKPVAYDFRAPHIHVRVLRPGGRSLTTQMMIAGDPQNARDSIYRRVRPDLQRLVAVELRPNLVGPDAGSTARFDLVLA